MKSSHTPGPITYDGWFPPRENGLLPSVKAHWDGRMLQLFTQDLEQGEIDMRLLQSAPILLEACKELLAQQVCPLGQYKADRWSVACDLARAAISKAEGNA